MKVLDFGIELIEETDVVTADNENNLCNCINEAAGCGAPLPAPEPKDKN